MTAPITGSFKTANKVYDGNTDAAGNVVQQATSPTFSRSGNLGACDSTAQFDAITEVVAPDSGVLFNWDGNQYQ